MRVFRADEFPPNGGTGDRAVMGRSSGPLGAVLLGVGVLAAVWAHAGAGASTARSDGPLLRTSLLVLVVLLVTGAGVPLLVHGARSPSRHLFRFGTLRLATVTLFVVGAAHLATLLWVDFQQLWRYGDVGACVIAGVGSVSAGAFTLVFAAITGRLAWRAFIDEYWLRDERT